MNYEIKKIDIWLTARFAGIFFGLIRIIPMIFGCVAFCFNSQTFRLEVLMFLFFPLGAFVGGFAIGLVFAAVYNAIAKEAGGIKMEIDYNQD